MVDIDADPLKPAEGHSFSRFLFPRHTPTHVFSHAFSLSSSYLRANKLHTLSFRMLSDLLKLSARASFSHALSDLLIMQATFQLASVLWKFLLNFL